MKGTILRKECVTDGPFQYFGMTVCSPEIRQRSLSGGGLPRPFSHGLFVSVALKPIILPPYKSHPTSRPRRVDLSKYTVPFRSTTCRQGRHEYERRVNVLADAGVTLPLYLLAWPFNTCSNLLQFQAGRFTNDGLEFTGVGSKPSDSESGLPGLGQVAW